MCFLVSLACETVCVLAQDCSVLSCMAIAGCCLQQAGPLAGTAAATASQHVSCISTRLLRGINVAALCNARAIVNNLVLDRFSTATSAVVAQLLLPYLLLLLQASSACTTITTAQLLALLVLIQHTSVHHLHCLHCYYYYCYAHQAEDDVIRTGTPDTEL
jgi:hypothetical protein